MDDARYYSINSFHTIVIRGALLTWNCHLLSTHHHYKKRFDLLRHHLLAMMHGVTPTPAFGPSG
jgi:hypothetical protein